MFSWKAQITKGDYRLQVETDNLEKYRAVEKLCQVLMDDWYDLDEFEIYRKMFNTYMTIEGRKKS